jgi:hypothetical protein
VIAKGLSDVHAAIRAQDGERAGKLVALQCELAKEDLLGLMAKAQS